MYIIINSRTGLRTQQTPLADLTFILIKNITFELILLSLYLYAVMIILREVIKLNPWT